MNKNFKKDDKEENLNQKILPQINTKMAIIKKNIKELQEIFYSLYKDEKFSNNNKLIFIKRGVDKLNSASRYLLALKFEKKESSSGLDKEVKDLYNKICKDVSVLDDKISRAYNMETLSKSSNYVGSLKNNLDNLRLGFDCLKRMDISNVVDKKED